MGLIDEIKRELAISHSINEIKSNLVKRGFLQEDVEKALYQMLNIKSGVRSKNENILSIKELTDRIGYGSASQQFVNILFMLSGASFFFIGLFNGIKTVLVTLLSGFLEEYSKVKQVSKNLISTSGIVYGFSFLGMSIAAVLKSPGFFAFSLIVGTLGIIAHGDLYLNYSKSLLKPDRKTFLKFISYFGILITSAVLLISGFIMQSIPIYGLNIIFAGMTFKIFGHILIFEITAIMFIISGYLLSFVQDQSEKIAFSYSTFSNIFKGYLSENIGSYRIFAKNNKVYLLTIATILTTIVQILGNSYYGIYIYNEYKNQFLGGFMNVALIFVIALIASLVGSIMTKKFAKFLGEAPMLVFGTLLIALMPITLYFNHNLYSIGLGAALSIVGSTIVGVAQGLLGEKLMNENELKRYYSSLGFVSIIPILLLVTLGALITQLFNLEFLFLVLGITLALVVMPLYFLIVVIVDSEYRKERRV